MLVDKTKAECIRTSITAGKTVTDKKGFKTHHPTYKSDVHDKFKAFAKACYSEFLIASKTIELTFRLTAAEEREELADVPFDDNEDPASTEPSPTDLPPSIPSASRKSTSHKKTPARKKTTSHKRAQNVDDAPSQVSLNSNASIENPENSSSDEARNTVNAEDDDDAMDIFSPALPSNRLIVDSKVDTGGLTLYKTAEGEWLSEIELERLANMARNARIMTELGLEEAKSRLATRPQGDKEPEPEDDREFSVARTRAALPPREQRPRLSKQDIS